MQKVLNLENLLRKMMKTFQRLNKHKLSAISFPASALQTIQCISQPMKMLIHCFFCGFATDKFLRRTKTGSRTFKNCRRRSALNPVRNRDQHRNLFSTFSPTAPNKWQGSSGEVCVRPWRGDLHVLCQLLCSQHSSGSRWARWRLINCPVHTGCSVWLQLLSCTYTTQLPPSLLLKMSPNSRPTNKQPQ